MKLTQKQSIIINTISSLIDYRYGYPGRGIYVADEFPELIETYLKNGGAFENISKDKDIILKDYEDSDLFKIDDIIDSVFKIKDTHYDKLLELDGVCYDYISTQPLRSMKYEGQTYDDDYFETKSNKEIFFYNSIKKANELQKELGIDIKIQEIADTPPFKYVRDKEEKVEELEEKEESSGVLVFFIIVVVLFSLVNILLSEG